MAELLDEDSRPKPIIAGSDLLAGAAINDRCLRVPDDLSLISYDGRMAAICRMAAILTAPLMTIAQRVAELGRGAVTLALNAMRNVKGPHSRFYGSAQKYGGTLSPAKPAANEPNAQLPEFRHRPQG